ncbi:MAG: response regulator [Eubacteriales bacterium]|nr:response regulator [Eubacteriales bacterium]
MWKVLIADDEPKIRQGLKNTLEMFDLPVSVCAEAKNGLEALEKSRELKPDILLVDICMPKLSGIKFLEEIRKLKLECKIIIISGFNEFTYARQAITLGVSEYLLKPIAEEELRSALEEILEELKQSRKSKKFMDLMQQQMQQNGVYLRDVFFNDWVEGNLSEEERNEQMEFLDIEIPEKLLLILVSLRPEYTGKLTAGTVSEELYKITLEKVMEDLIGEYKPVYVFMSRYQDVAGVIGGYRDEIEKLNRRILDEVEKLVGGKCCVQIRSCRCGEIPKVYEEMRANARKVLECRPIVLQARKYIYANYEQRELDLTQVADAIGCNPSYLSRTMKQELGISFKDFLTKLRIGQAIQLMQNNQLSLNQIAERVGYSNQHYFSAAFKNCQGVSPSEYRRNLTQD